MADSVVTFLVQNLQQLLIQEINFLAGVEDQVKSLQKELNLINAFLKDSEGKQNEHEIVKEVIRQIRDVAYEVEDVIDLYIYNKAMQKRRNIAWKTFHFINHKAKLHDIGNKIGGLNVEINKIYNNIEKFGIKRAEASMQAGEAEALHNRRRYVEEDDVVGFVQDSTILVKQLTEGTLELDINSIIGMGGLGKTTLARKVYNNVRVKSHFNCRAWVYVSQDFKSKELLIEILKSEMQTVSESNFKLSPKSLLEELSKRKLEDMGEKELKDKLKKYLREKTYLIVMDDVWRTEVWDEMKTAFPDNLNGSRILITSREQEVASYAGCDTPDQYHLPFLNKDESWELLEKKIFRRENCPPELEDLGRQIAESCDGLPLSIVVMGGLLKKEERRKPKWEKYIGNVNWYLTRDKRKCKDILALSYTHLPRYLKPCFLYFGVYPEDTEISVRQLIQLWIAEGFIEDTGVRILEDLAEDYLDELVERSLIQVASRRTDGGIKTCRIHDLLRDLCISESAEDKFFEVRTNVKLLSTNRTRRLSILGNTPLYISSNPSDPSGARSLLFFDQDTHTRSRRFQDQHWNWVFENFKLVRVLNLGHTVVPYSISQGIEKLVHLKYLRIATGAPNVIPNSICNLWYLETLDVRRFNLACLPIGIWKLQRLRNLHMLGPVHFPAPLDTDNKALDKLRVLSTIQFDLETATLMGQGKFPGVKKLGIYCSGVKCREWGFLPNLQHLSHLQTLKIVNFSWLPTKENSFPSTITKITLTSAGINTMKVLGNLPRLRILKLHECTIYGKLHVIADSFPELDVLKLDNLKMEEWKQGRGAMPRLRHLVFKNCTGLTMLPGELCNMTSLRDVEVLWTTLKLVVMFQELQTKIGCKLQIYPPPDDKFYKQSCGRSE